MNATITISADPHTAEVRLWRLSLGGRFALYRADDVEVTPKGRKSRAILAHLAAHAGEHVRREQLIELLWGDRFETQARLSLRQSLFEIRRAAGNLLIHSDREHLWMEASALEIVDGGGEPFAGLSGITSEFDDWLRLERERRANAAFAKLGNEAERLIADGRGAEALPLIERMRRIDPLHEGWLRLALESDYQAGNPSAIEKRFNEFAQLLERELGVSPATETRALRDRLLTELTRSPPPSPQNSGVASAQPPIQAPPRQRRARLLDAISGGKGRPAMFTAAAILPLILIAVGAHEVAVQQQHRAEGMAEFMLGDLKDKLEPTGKLDAIEGVASRVLDYYKDKSDGDLSDSELRQRSRALALLGQAQFMRGNIGAATRFFQQASGGTAEEVRRKPDDPQRLFDQAQNVFWIGEIQRERGNLKGAESAYREYQRLALKMEGLDPDSMKWRMEEQYADANLGIVLFNQRRLPEAAAQFQGALQTIDALATANPDKADYQKSLSESLAWFADTMMYEGKLDVALALRNRQVAFLNRQLSRTGDIEYRRKLIPAEQALGNIYSLRGNIPVSLQHLQAATTLADTCAQMEPANTLWVQYGTRARIQYAENLLRAGQRAEAGQQALAASATARQLLARDNNRPEWRALLRDVAVVRARLALAEGNGEQALSFAKEAVSAAKSVASNDRVADAFALAKAYRVSGDANHGVRNEAAARADWNAALSALPRNVPERPSELAEHLQILQRAGPSQETQPISGALAAMGVRSFG